MNVAELLNRHARYLPDKLALVFEDQRLTYRQYNAEVNRLAHALMGLGIKKGDKVATLLPNRQETLESYWAVTKIGAVLVPMSTLLLGSGLKTLLNDSDAVAVITSSGFLGHLAEIMPDLPAIAPERVLLVDGPQEGYADYHALKAAASDQNPVGIQVDQDDMFNIIYSSGNHISRFEAMARLGIPCVGHVGLVPLKATWYGGTRAVGKHWEEANWVHRKTSFLENKKSGILEFQ